MHCDLTTYYSVIAIWMRSACADIVHLGVLSGWIFFEVHCHKRHHSTNSGPVTTAHVRFGCNSVPDASVASRRIVSRENKKQKILEPFLDLCVSSLREGHANLLCIVPILTDVAEATPATSGQAHTNMNSLFNLRVWAQ